MCFCSPRGCSLHSTIASRADRCSGPKEGSFLPGQLMQMNGAVVNQGTIMGTIHPPFDSRALPPRSHQRQHTQHHLDLVCSHWRASRVRLCLRTSFFPSGRSRLSLRLQDLALVSRHPLQNLPDCGLALLVPCHLRLLNLQGKLDTELHPVPCRYKSILRGQARPRGTKGRDVTPNLP